MSKKNDSVLNELKLTQSTTPTIKQSHTNIIDDKIDQKQNNAKSSKSIDESLFVLINNIANLTR